MGNKYKGPDYNFIISINWYAFSVPLDVHNSVFIKWHGKYRPATHTHAVYGKSETGGKLKGAARFY